MSDLVLALRTFVRIADGHSFSRVAVLTGASHTTIARRMDQLEAHFGTRLLSRTTRRLSLTPEGIRLLDHARAVIEAMDHAESDLAGETAASGIVRVGVTTALGLHYAALLTALHQRHPGLRIEFAVADWQGPLAENGLDLALRVGIPAPDQQACEPLGLIERTLVAAPAYIATRGTPENVATLLDHSCIAYGYGPAPAIWTIAGRSMKVSGCFRANSSEAVYRAAASGLGIAMLPEIQVRQAIAAGDLIRLLPGEAIEPLHLSVEHRYAGLRLPVRVRVVQEFLRDHFPHAGAPARTSSL